MFQTAQHEKFLSWIGTCLDVSSAAVNRPALFHCLDGLSCLQSHMSLEQCNGSACGRSQPHVVASPGLCACCVGIGAMTLGGNKSTSARTEFLSPQQSLDHGCSSNLEMSFGCLQDDKMQRKVSLSALVLNDKLGPHSFATKTK